jgi:hypothetical protein
MMTAPSSPLFLPRVMQQVLVALALMLLPVGSRSAGWDIDELMRKLAQIQSGHSSFVEKKSIAVLDQAVESSGELFYTARPSEKAYAQTQTRIHDPGSRHPGDRAWPQKT